MYFYKARSAAISALASDFSITESESLFTLIETANFSSDYLPMLMDGIRYLVLPNADGSPSKFLQAKIGSLFRYLWRLAPNREVLGLLTSIDLRVPTLHQWLISNNDFAQEIYQQEEPDPRDAIESANLILEAITDSVSEGWVVFQPSEEHQKKRIPDQYSGRLFLPIEILNRDRLLNVVDQLEAFQDSSHDSQLTLEADYFWKIQGERAPVKVVERLVDTLFGHLPRTISALEKDLQWIREFKSFTKYSIQSIEQILEEAPKELLQYFPEYAGYKNVSGSKWLAGLSAGLGGQTIAATLKARG